MIHKSIFFPSFEHLFRYFLSACFTLQNNLENLTLLLLFYSDLGLKFTQFQVTEEDCATAVVAADRNMETTPKIWGRLI